MARLNHPNIVVRIYHLGSGEEPPHFVMEYLDRRAADPRRRAAHLRSAGRIDAQSRALAASFLHAPGNPSSRLQTRQYPGRPRSRTEMLDFGLALDLPERASASPNLARSPARPNTSRPNRPAARSIWTRAAMSSRWARSSTSFSPAPPPFRGGAAGDLLRRIREDDPVLPRRINPDIPKDLQNICLKALEKDSARPLCFGARDGRRSPPLSCPRIGARRARRLRSADRRQRRRAPARPRRVAPRPDRLRGRVRRHPQTLRAPARAGRLLDHGSAPPHPAAGQPLPGRLGAAGGRGAADVLSVSLALPAPRP